MHNFEKKLSNDHENGACLQKKAKVSGPVYGGTGEGLGLLGLVGLGGGLGLLDAVEWEEALGLLHTVEQVKAICLTTDAVA